MTDAWDDFMQGRAEQAVGEEDLLDGSAETSSNGAAASPAEQEGDAIGNRAFFDPPLAVPTVAESLRDAASRLARILSAL